MEQGRGSDAAPPASAGPQTVSIEEAMARAYAHWNAGQNAQAEYLCQQVMAVWPQNADALHLLGLLAHTHGNKALAIEYLRRACATPRAPALFYSNLAEMCRQSGLLAEGEAAARRALALDVELAAAWNNLGIILQEAGKLDESLDCLRRVVAINPNNAESRNNLGNTLKRLGHLGEARREYDAALAINPQYSEAHSNLANLLNELGEIEQAAVAARRAIDISPRNADAYLNAAAIALAARRQDEAMRWINQILGFAPNHAGALAARAGILRDTDDLPEAERSARAAVAAAPENGEALETLAQVLQATGRDEESLAMFDRAIATPHPQPDSPLLSKAVLLMEMGRTAESMAIYDRLLEIRPDSAKAWFNRCEMKTFAAGDPDIDRMEGLLAAARPRGLGSSYEMLMHFALGKAWMDAGDADRAFAHFDAGNRLKRATIDFDGAATRDWMASIGRTFSSALLERFAGAGDPSEVPVFLVGMPRSGTTLIEQILASHPDVYGAGELKTMQALVDGVRPDLRGRGYPAMVDEFRREDFAELGRRYLARVLPLASGRRRIVDKMPANFLHVGLIALALPRARIIHCRRDPVDTCLSCYTKLFVGEQKFAYDLAELGGFHRSYQDLTTHWRKVLPPERLIEVDYEAVVEDLEGQARRLIDFLGLGWDDACLRFHENKRSVRTASVNQVRQPIYRTSTGRWRAHARHLGPLLDALGIAADAR